MTQLGLTKGALYHFFPTKELLAQEIVTRHFSRFPPVAQAVLADTGNKLDALIEITYQVARMFQEDPITRAGARLTNERNLIPTELPRPFVGWIATVVSILESGKSLGHLRSDIDPTGTAEIIVAFFFGAQTLSNEFNGRRDLKTRLDRFWALFVPILTPA